MKAMKAYDFTYNSKTARTVLRKTDVSWGAIQCSLVDMPISVCGFLKAGFKNRFFG
jgi:hypothetical protein